MPELTHSAHSTHEGDTFRFVTSTEPRTFMVVDNATRKKVLYERDKQEGKQLIRLPDPAYSHESKHTGVVVLERVDCRESGRYAMVTEKWLREGKLSGHSESYWEKVES